MYVRDESHRHSTPDLSLPLSQQSLIAIVSSKSEIKKMSDVGFSQQSFVSELFKMLIFLWGPIDTKTQILTVYSQIVE